MSGLLLIGVIWLSVSFGIPIAWILTNEIAYRRNRR